MKIVKTTLLTVGIFLLGYLSVLGQPDVIEVDPNDNVRFGTRAVIGDYQLPTNPYPSAVIYAQSTTTNGAGNGRYGIYSLAQQNQGSMQCIGVCGRVNNSQSGVYAPQIGVLGINSSQSGPNMGVAGITLSSVNGVGVYGGQTMPASFSGTYAGYFNGDVHITTKLKVNATTYSSDYRYKQNIEELNQQKTFVNVLNLNPVEYNLKQRYLDAIDSLGNPIKVECFDEKSELFQKKHYGLIAQEVREIYPDLVYEDGDGYLSIDYVGIIPLLIQSVKELNSTIKAQNAKIKQLETNNMYANSPVLKSSTNTTGEESILSMTSAVLYQNVPNPFNQSTEIRYYIPENSQSAQLCIYNLQGNQIKQISIAECGEGTQVITGSELTAGMYLYTLIVDGKEVDTKRMILTG